MSTPDTNATPTEEELKQLPRWARVAFAARCARRVQPLYKAGWPDAPQKHVEALDRAVTLSEQAAAAAYADPAAADPAAADPAANLAAAADAVYGRDVDHTFIASASLFDTVSTAIDASATIANKGADYMRAANAARVAARAFARVVVHHGASRIDAFAVVTAVIRRDYDLLLAATTQLGWTDDTPVPPEFFGPMWPEGRPAGWPEPDQQPEPKELVIEIDVPEDATREEVLAKVRELALHANALHRAHGGKGLRVEDVDIEYEARVREGVAS